MNVVWIRASRLVLSLLLGLGLAAPLMSCSRPESGASRQADFVARPDARRYELRGKVVRVDLTARTVTLAHDAIPDYMDAMTMAFTVKEEWALAQMGAGDEVRASMVVDGARTWLESPAITKATNTNDAPRGSWVPADPGTPLPDVALVDQDAQPFRLDRYHGHPLLVTFSFTRCPLPDYCPLMMRHFAALEKATAADAALRQTRLLTVTIDPAYDTPAILRAYGAKHATGDGPRQPFSRWQLATGAAADIKTLAGFFGLDYFTEGGKEQIIHSLRTAIVDPRGRVCKVFEGNEWTVDEVMRELRGACPTPAPATAGAGTAAPGGR